MGWESNGGPYCPDAQLETGGRDGAQKEDYGQTSLGIKEKIKKAGMSLDFSTIRINFRRVWKLPFSPWPNQLAKYV